MEGRVFWFLFTGLAFQRLEKGLARVGETKSLNKARQSAGLKSSNNT
jgi:hypothetical protein